MSKLFFADTLSDISISYGDLLAYVNKDAYVSKNLKTKNVAHFFQNMVKAIVSNENITLLDFDFTDVEINNLIGNEYVEEIVTTGQLAINDLNELLDRIGNSTSTVHIFTSGTTGQPKKISHDIKTLTREVKRGDKFENNIWAFAYNPTHIAGIQVFFQALMNLNPIINVFNCSRDEVYNTCEHYGITNISATPTFYRMLLPADKQLLKMTRVTIGGEKSSEWLYEKIKLIFPNSKISNIYASTEAGTLLAANGEYFSIPAHMLGKIKIENNELFVHRSLMGTSGHLTLEGDWYNTGDVIEWVEEGKQFKFLSRKNEMINTGGYKVNPHEVEDVIRLHPAVKEVLVYGKPNSVIGNILCADIVLKENEQLKESDITHYLNEKLQSFKIPRKINFVATVALSRTGKATRVNTQK